MTEDEGEAEFLKLAAPFSATCQIDQVALAIYGAEDPLSGDSIATVIHMSEHLFWDDRFPGKRDIDRQLSAVRAVCRAAAKAAMAAQNSPETLSA